MSNLETIACPVCGTELENSGAVSHGDGDISDEYFCPSCEEMRLEIHASYCRCDDCRDGISKWHWLY